MKSMRRQFLLSSNCLQFRKVTLIVQQWRHLMAGNLTGTGPRSHRQVEKSQVAQVNENDSSITQRRNKTMLEGVCHPSHYYGRLKILVTFHSIRMIAVWRIRNECMQS